MPPDALTLANQFDAEWHGQARSFEREAIARFWGLLTLPARALDPSLPGRLLKEATVLRNGRFRGRAVHRMFFADQQFTEVDALFLQVGSPLGHSGGDDAWVVEVERKAQHQRGDYFRAMHRARRFARLLREHFGVRARPVVIYEDQGGTLSYPTFEDDVLLATMTTLRARTRGLTFSSVHDLPGAGCDTTLLKLGLMRLLVQDNPHIPRGLADPARLARALEQSGWPVRHPAPGHLDLDALPASMDAWLAREREQDEHLAARVDRALDELVHKGLVVQRTPEPRLSWTGGQAVLQWMQLPEPETR